jgi:hypothetical protein
MVQIKKNCLNMLTIPNRILLQHSHPTPVNDAADAKSEHEVSKKALAVI